MVVLCCGGCDVDIFCGCVDAVFCESKKTNKTAATKKRTHTKSAQKMKKGGKVEKENIFILWHLLFNRNQ